MSDKKEKRIGLFRNVEPETKRQLISKTKEFSKVNDVKISEGKMLDVMVQSYKVKKVGK